MRNLGIVLLVLGTIVGSLGGAKLPTANWAVAGAGFAMLVAALVLLRWPKKGDGTKSADAPEKVVIPLLRELPKEIEAIRLEAEDLELPALLERLGKLDREFLQGISEGSPALLSSLGPQRFADVFGQYASGERLLARAWSAAADHHRPEALDALERSALRIREAVEYLGEPTA